MEPAPTRAYHAIMNRRIVLTAGLAVAAGLSGAAAIAWRPAIASIAPPSRAAFPSDAVARGATLAAIGDCSVCHTADGGRPYAGGRGLPTPFGTIYVTNITPDPDTGIGRWPEAAFRRAMRDGIDREGRHLYPALPYPHFTRATDADIEALYAFLMTREPVQATAPANRLPFPLNVRATLTGWNMLFLRPGAWTPDPAQSPDLDRGAYLVEAVGHCGACHTPHNALGAERDTQALGGGVAEGWSGHPLQAGSPAAQPWTVDELADYLATGLSAQHGAAAGPMLAVTRELSRVPAADVRAIAAYVASGMPRSLPQPAPQEAAAEDPVFTGACAACHAAAAPMTRAGAPSLALSTTVNAPSPRNAIRVILHGIATREDAPSPIMPGFGAALSDQQVADLVRYVRTRYSSRPPWTGIEADVRAARTEETDP
jgi:mono/diheme cytochrome c family protein